MLFYYKKLSTMCKDFNCCIVSFEKIAKNYDKNYDCNYFDDVITELYSVRRTLLYKIMLFNVLILLNNKF